MSPTLCNPLDCAFHEILQATILKWVAIPFSRGSFQPKDRTQVSHTAGVFLPSEPLGKPKNTEWVVYPFSSISLNPGIKLGSPSLQADSLPAELPGKPEECSNYCPIALISHAQKVIKSFKLGFSNM